MELLFIGVSIGVVCISTFIFKEVKRRQEEKNALATAAKIAAAASAAFLLYKAFKSLYSELESHSHSHNDIHYASLATQDKQQESEKYRDYAKDEERRSHVKRMQKMQRNGHYAKAEEYNKTACDIIFKANNPQLVQNGKLTRIDLHCLLVKEAKEKVIEHLNKAAKAGVNKFKIITGKGRHSVAGKPKIKRAIIELLDDKNIYYKEVDGGGSLCVDLNKSECCLIYSALYLNTNFFVVQREKIKKDKKTKASKVCILFRMSKMADDYILISRYDGGFVYQHFWTVSITFSSDLQNGKIEFNREDVTLPPTKFHNDFAENIKKIVKESKIDQIPSGDSYEDKGYGNLLLHLSLQGKKFMHTPPQGSGPEPPVPTPDQLSIFSSFVNSVLSAAHQLIPDIPTHY